MKKEVYHTTTGRILAQTWAIWLIIVIHIVANIFIIPPSFKNNQPAILILINLVLGALSIPGLFLFWKYYHYSRHKEFIITGDKLLLIDHKTGKQVEMMQSDVNKIYRTDEGWKNRLPWSGHEYFFVTDKLGQKILITSYMMPIGSFWMSTLTRKVNSDGLTSEKRTYPLFK
jgi:hypothetical protein